MKIVKNIRMYEYHIIKEGWEGNIITYKKFKAVARENKNSCIVCVREFNNKYCMDIEKFINESEVMEV